MEKLKLQLLHNGHNRDTTYVGYTQLEKFEEVVSLALHNSYDLKINSIYISFLLLQVCEVYRLHRETFHLAVDFVDRYLSSQRNVAKQRLQLIGVTSLFIAAKIEVDLMLDFAETCLCFIYFFVDLSRIRTQRYGITFSCIQHLLYTCHLFSSCKWSTKSWNVQGILVETGPLSSLHLEKFEP